MIIFDQRHFCAHACMYKQSRRGQTFNRAPCICLLSPLLVYMHVRHVALTDETASQHVRMYKCGVSYLIPYPATYGGRAGESDTAYLTGTLQKPCDLTAGKYPAPSSLHGVHTSSKPAPALLHSRRHGSRSIGRLFIFMLRQQYRDSKQWQPDGPPRRACPPTRCSMMCPGPYGCPIALHQLHPCRPVGPSPSADPHPSCYFVGFNSAQL